MFLLHFDFISSIAQTQGNMDSQPSVKAAMLVDNTLKVFRRLNMKMELAKFPDKRNDFVLDDDYHGRRRGVTCKVTIVFGNDVTMAKYIFFYLLRTIFSETSPERDFLKIFTAI